MVKRIVMVVVLGLSLVGGANSAMVVSFGDTVSNSGISGGFTDSYILSLSVDTDIEIMASYSNMTFSWAELDFFLLELSGDDGFNQGWAGTDGVLETGVLSLFSGSYTLDVSGVGFSPGGDYDLAIVPLPAAVWLFGSALVGLVVFARRRRV